jgi:hypothetical protein
LSELLELGSAKADALFLSTGRFNTRASHIQCCPRQPELFFTGQHVAALREKLCKTGEKRDSPSYGTQKMIGGILKSIWETSSIIW